ncbi:prophage tail fiber N-terminal domain-containing protein [Pectobacterium betavasculorum]|uniref:phage tail fiber protein n=1 Tax=Pectobacterium betavasculorum TaxID=55207 RepID=UPI000691CED7|nr:prophage tail fiber N-terminal domain-containing protein [Pectobacterium betavasculorum]
MSVLISGALLNPAGIPVAGAEITFTALTTSDSVLNGFSASTVTNDNGEYAIPLEHCVYSIAIQSDGYNSIYGSVSINEKSTPTTINELLKLATMEQAVTPAVIVYFREIQTDVAAKLATMQTLSNNATTAARDATTARNQAAQYAQSLSAAVAQAQQASTSATASANASTLAKNAAETAARNAQNTLTDAMKKSANGGDITDSAAFRANLGLKDAATNDAQASPTDSTAGRVLKIASNGAGPFGLGSAASFLSTSDVVVQLRGMQTGFARCTINTVRAPTSAAWLFNIMRWDSNTCCVIAISTVPSQGLYFIVIGSNTDSGWQPLWAGNNLTLPISTNNGGSGTNTGAFANGPNTQAPSTIAAFLASVAGYGNNSAGSASISDDAGSWHTYLSVKHRSGSGDGINYGFILEDRGMTSSDYTGFVLRKQLPTGWLPPVNILHSGNTVKQSNTMDTTPNSVLLNGAFGMGLGISQATVPAYTDITTSGITRTFKSPQGGVGYPTTDVAWCGQHWAYDHNAGASLAILAAQSIGQVRAQVNVRRNANQLGWLNVLLSNQYVTDSGGFYKTASPVVNIYSDGSFTTTDEAAGVNVERLSEGVYKITGCHGMHSDAAWNGIDGGVSNPRCRNGLELTWNDFSVESDGSVIVRTYHRPHPYAISFARNEIDGYKNGDPIDIPRGLFIQVRVNMPEREEPKPTVMHSNVYCNSVSYYNYPR